MTNDSQEKACHSTALLPSSSTTRASLVASFAAGSPLEVPERMTAVHTDVLIATFRCDAPARLRRVRR